MTLQIFQHLEARNLTAASYIAAHHAACSPMAPLAGRLQEKSAVMPLDLPPPSSEPPDVFDAQLDAHIFEDLWGPGGCGPQLLAQEVSSGARSL